MPGSIMLSINLSRRQRTKKQTSSGRASKSTADKGHIWKWVMLGGVES
jgi:hypothetical protein